MAQEITDMGGEEKCYLYVHGKLGYKEEAESFAKIVTAKNWQVLSIDSTRWNNWLC